MVGGSAGPIAIILVLPILVASIVIGIKAPFFVATITSVLLLASLWTEARNILPQVIEGRWEEIARGSGEETLLLYMGASIRIISFYLVAFLSWFAASREAWSRASGRSRSWAVAPRSSRERAMRKWFERQPAWVEAVFRLVFGVAVAAYAYWRVRLPAWELRALAWRRQ